MTAGFGPCKTARLKLLQSPSADEGNLIHEDCWNDGTGTYEDDDIGQVKNTAVRLLGTAENCKAETKLFAKT